ncbi:two-component system NtrC family response regulator [Desulfobotulus alkaliphilus]|uniref:Two-component system NtrC family response regulator n=1 Tax=Desulfobotulus alkaliphilus TaxID=622671 RepID=A0A562RDS2_9BACT|nr:sigma-54 dependent transcriptional regulator [Desulfobotulus alkaliphilus]TWI67227.1 two-component system NtrC family response regulator [Desulfobotulus alkaliphilus]
MADILVIDDDVVFCETMASLIQRMEHGFHAFHTLREGVAFLSGHSVDVVFLDVRLPDGNGLDAIPRIRASLGNPEVIILTGLGDPDGAELAIAAGVWDYLVKPFSVKQTRLSLDRALRYRLEKQQAREPEPLDLSSVVGEGPAMKACYTLLAQAARSDSRVLITGETGTGKELFARTIHDNSGRSKGEFVVVDCASITETLLESTLFGHKKGAFTGADSDRTGLVKMADGGTLFLDEVGDMPLSIQKSFLRVLQERRFRPVGETRELTSDFRLIAATNRNLQEMVEEGKFRQDLLFRLWTISLRLPPLRERGAEDIRGLSRVHIRNLCQKAGVAMKEPAPDFLEVLLAYDWPGNVRELFNVLEVAFVASRENRTLYAMDLPPEVRIRVMRAALSDGGGNDALGESRAFSPVPSFPAMENALPESLQGDLPSLKDFKTEMEALYLDVLMKRTGGSPQEMMSVSGLSKSHFYALLKKYGRSLK